MQKDLYGGDRQLLLDNIAGGLTRTQFFKVLGMDADTPNHTQDFDPRGDRTTAQVIDTRYVDLNGNPIITDYNAGDNTFLIDAYQINGNWAGDNSGIFFVGIDEMGNDMLLPVNSNSELIDFDTIASTLAGTSRDGDFNTINLQDRAFLRGLGYELNPIVPIVLEDGLRVSFEGIDQLQSGDGNDAFCIRSSNVDFEVRGGIGNDNFIVTGLGVGAIDLYGEAGDDTYSVVFSPAGVITIVDSEGSENDTLNGLGTSAADTFVFEENGVRVNGGLLVYTGIENISFNGQGNDDVFDIRAATNGITGLSGGAGNDTFIVNDLGAGANGNTLTVSVNDPLVDPLDQLRLEIESVISDTYLADQIENLQVDGTFIINGVNGTPTVAGGLNLLGDGNERLIVDSSVDASWLVDGNGSGTVTMDVDPMTFTGLEEITSGHGVDDFNVIATDTDLLVHLRDGDDSFRANSAGMGMLTVDGNLGNDTFEILNSGGGIVFRGNEGEDDFTVNDGGLSAVNLSGDGDNDTFMILRAGVAGVMLTGDDGDDHVTIDNSAGTGPIMAQGGNGNDQFDVVQSGPGDLTLMGEVGDDLYNVYQVEPATIFTILDSVNSENDQLGVFGTDNDDTLELELDGLTYNGGEKWDIQGIESYSIDGMLGNDSITVTMGASFTGDVTVLGNDGDDILTVVNSGSGTVTMDGGEGDDQHIVHFMSFTNVTVTDSGTGTNDNFTGFGTGFDDTISLAADTANVNGGTVMMVGIETVLVDGLGGDDTFNIDTNVAQTTVMGSFGNDLFNIMGVADGNLFHGNQGNDTFNVTATGAAMYRGDEGNDEFTVAGTDGGGEFYGGIDMDTFHVMDNTGELSFFGEAGVDHFNIENHTPLGSSGVMRIDGGDDRNTMTVTGYQSHGNFATITSSTITGMSGIPIEYSASGSFSLGQPIGGITLIGSANFNDGFTAASLKRLDSLLMLGGGGNDRFTVSEGTLGRVSADGEEGSDLYQYAVGSMNNRNLLALDTGVTGSDRIVISMTEGADNLTLAGEAFTVQTDNFKFNQNFESMIVNARGGDDVIDINHVAVGFMRIIGGTGNDNFVVNNFSGVNSMLLQAGSGDDTITVNAGTVDGFLNAYGGTGNDTFTISQSTYSNSQINGEEGSDTYNISVADRSSRYVVARDTGTVGTDTMNVYGTVLNDRFDLRVGLISVQQQRVFYNQNTETTNIMTGGAPDIASVYGFSSPEVNLMSGADDDLVFVHSTFGPIVNKVLNVSLGFGNDSALVKTTNAGSTVNISGDGGNDLLNMGSSLADNNGNLGAIQGEVHFDGGVGNDRVNLNDVGRGATAFYDLGPGFVRDGGSPSATFAGLTFAGTENVRLDGTPYRNHVDVSASTETTFRIFGNGGYNSVTLVDGDDAELFGQSGGSGGWTFDNDLKDVYFEDFFVI